MQSRMKTKLRLIRFVLLLSFAAMVSLGSVTCLGQLAWRISIDVEVAADGSATWLVQQKTTLVTEDDEASFFEYLNITSVEVISNHVQSIVDQASLVTGRSMRVENLDVTGNVTTRGLSTEGILQYQFDWVGFAEIAGDAKIVIGDALNGELDLLQYDVLMVTFPREYSSVFVYPQPSQVQESENTLTWYGPKDFGAGEPHGLFEKRISSWADVITSNAAILVALIFAVLSCVVGYFFGYRRARMIEGLNTIVRKEQASIPELSDEDDEEKIVKLLVAAGGRMQQLTIARECGFSKSKASEVLSTMEKKGVIKRKKLGRGKIVSLNEIPKN